MTNRRILREVDSVYYGSIGGILSLLVLQAKWVTAFGFIWFLLAVFGIALVAKIALTRKIRSLEAK